MVINLCQSNNEVHGFPQFGKLCQSKNIFNHQMYVLTLYSIKMTFDALLCIVNEEIWHLDVNVYP